MLPKGHLYFLFLLISTHGTLLPDPCRALTVKETLPNGLTVAIVENRGTTSVSVDLWIKAGSRYEAPRNNGISHFVEHLLFKGTAKRSAKDIAREISSVGGSINACTTWEYTQVHISILPAHLDLALEILADVAQNSLMTEEMVEKERKVILEEISLGRIYPPTFVLNLVSRTLFPENSLELPICGTQETVNAIQRKDLLQFYRRYYTPNNAFLTLVGQVDAPWALELIRQKLGPWTRGQSLPPSFSPPRGQARFQEIRERKFLDQAIVVLALQAMGWKDADRPSFEIINAVLGSGGNSRLYQEIREKQGLSYLVGSIYYPLSDTGFWAVYVGTAPQNLKKVKRTIFQEVARIQEEPLSAQELGEMKSYIRGKTLIRNENNWALSDFIGQGLLADSPEMPQKYLTKVEAVTAEDVIRVARTYLREERRNLIILKPYPGLRFFRSLF